MWVCNPSEAVILCEVLIVSLTQGRLTPFQTHYFLKNIPYYMSAFFVLFKAMFYLSYLIDNSSGAYIM